jgi:Ca2+-binding RTX toxin-like protein
VSKKTISSDSNDRWNITGSHGTWTLEADAELYVINAPAIWVGKKATHNTINILGDIVNNDAISRGAGAAGTHSRALGPVDAIGVGVVGDHNKFVVGEDASITAVYGIWGPASHTDVINHGAISAIVLGIGFDASADIRNFGTVSAVIGIMGGHGTRIFNGEDGRIVGYDVGVEFIGGHDTLINHGAVSGAYYSVYDDGGASKIFNDGRLDGNVYLGFGDDTLDTRGGTIDGDVRGGVGDDTYLVSNQKIRIVELDTEGFDTVKSTVSYVLGDFVERLVLLGKNDIDGTGNDASNMLAGNSGDNVLKGLAGSDVLRGGAGTDRLNGGADSDIFRFIKGDQTDIIVDYTDEVDLIQILDTGFHNFNQLKSHIEEHGPDTWIMLGGDDKIVLRNIFDMSVLEKTDFAFEPIPF